MRVRYLKNVRFECQRCARCCGDTPHRGRNILLLEEEVRNISKLTGMKISEFTVEAKWGAYTHRIKKRNGKCPFLNGKACKVYNHRPLVCRLYPFSIEKSGNTYTFEASEDCPGIDLGDMVQGEEFKKMFEGARAALD